MKLSVLIPVYNEERTIDEILRLVTSEPIDKEIVVVDDGSTDGTREMLRAWDGRAGVRVILQPRNLGKGRAVRTAIEAARGEILIIQDADLEYDPAEYPRLLAADRVRPRGRRLRLALRRELRAPRPELLAPAGQPRS